MIPIQDTVRASRRPLVTYLIIGVNFIVFLHFLGIADDQGAWAAARWQRDWSLVPRQLLGALRQAQGLSETLGALAPLLTHMFLHGGWGHILGNMLFLYIFGDNVEDRLGRPLYGLFYLGCGVTAALFQIALGGDPSLPMLGASGAVAGVLGAYFVLFPRARIVTLVPIFFFPLLFEIRAWVFLIVWLVFQNVFPATLGPGTQGGGVAYWAHIGGFGAGALVAWLWRDQLLRRRIEKRGAPRAVERWDDWGRSRGRDRRFEWYREWKRGAR